MEMSAGEYYNVLKRDRTCNRCPNGRILLGPQLGCSKINKKAQGNKYVICRKACLFKS